MKSWTLHAIVTFAIALGVPLLGIFLLPTPHQLGNVWLWIAAFVLSCMVGLLGARWFHTLMPERSRPRWSGGPNG